MVLNLPTEKKKSFRQIVVDIYFILSIEVTSIWFLKDTINYIWPTALHNTWTEAQNFILHSLNNQFMS